MWELDHKEGWAWKKWCFWTVMLEKTLENPLVSKEIKLVNPKGYQPWILIGRTDDEVENPLLWQPDMKNWLIWINTDARKDCRWEEKGTTEDEIVGRHLRLDGLEFEQAPGVGDEQGSLEGCIPRVSRSHIWLSEWTELIHTGKRFKLHILIKY